jgi:hypothetical protein
MSRDVSIVHTVLRVTGQSSDLRSRDLSFQDLKTIISGNGENGYPGMELRDIGPEQRKMVIIGAESTCELCGEYIPASLLERYRIPGSPTIQESDNPQRGLLVLCHSCHLHAHNVPLPRVRQQELARKREFNIRKEMRKIPGYRPKPYIPPDETDWERLYNSVSDLGSIVLNGT